MRNIAHKISPMRMLLASLGLLSASIAYASAALSAPWAGRCLSEAAPTLLHCPWCWAAAVLLLAAVVPIPRRILLQRRP